MKSRHALDCGLCCGLEKCDCGVDNFRLALEFEHIALIVAVVSLVAAYFIGQI